MKILTTPTIAAILAELRNPSRTIPVPGNAESEIVFWLDSAVDREIERLAEQGAILKNSDGEGLAQELALQTVKKSPFPHFNGCDGLLNAFSKAVKAVADAGHLAAYYDCPVEILSLETALFKAFDNKPKRRDAIPRRYEENIATLLACPINLYVSENRIANWRKEGVPASYVEIFRELRKAKISEAKRKGGRAAAIKRDKK